MIEQRANKRRTKGKKGTRWRIFEEEGFTEDEVRRLPKKVRQTLMEKYRMY